MDNLGLTAGTMRRLKKEKIRKKNLAAKSFHIAGDGIICRIEKLIL